MPAEGEVNVSTILQSLGNSLGDMIQRVGERLPNILFPQSQPTGQLPATQGPPSFLATLFSPASWTIGHYLLIGGVVYYFMRKRR